MLEFLQNQWVVGIGCSLISSIIVYSFSRFLFRRKENQRYFEQIVNSNKEIIRILKPYVAEKGLPEIEIVNAIISSVARKNKVKREDLYSIRIICEDLICEIIENVYVSTDKKREYSIQLNDYLNNLYIIRDKGLITDDMKNEVKLANDILKFEFKRRQEHANSILMALMTMTMTVTVMFLTIIDDRIFIPNITKSDEIMIVTTGLTIVLMIIIVLSDKIVKMTKNILKNKNHDRNDKKED